MHYLGRYIPISFAVATNATEVQILKDGKKDLQNEICNLDNFSAIFMKHFTALKYDHYKELISQGEIVEKKVLGKNQEEEKQRIFNEIYLNGIYIENKFTKIVIEKGVHYHKESEQRFEITLYFTDPSYDQYERVIILDSTTFEIEYSFMEHKYSN